MSSNVPNIRFVGGDAAGPSFLYMNAMEHYDSQQIPLLESPGLAGSLAGPGLEGSLAGPGLGWKQPDGPETLDTHWWHLFTEDGTFVAEGVGMRDFSDVGPVALEATYTSVVQRLREKSTPLESNVLQQDDSSADAPRIAASCECVDAVRIHKLSGVV